MKTNYAIRVTFVDGREESFEKETKWNTNSLRAWLVRKYPDCLYIYIVEKLADEDFPKVTIAPAAAPAAAAPVGGWDAFNKECEQDAQEVASYDPYHDPDMTPEKWVAQGGAIVIENDAPAAAPVDRPKVETVVTFDGRPEIRTKVDLPALARRREAAFHQWRNALAYGYLDECRRLHAEMDDIKAQVKAEVGFELVDFEWSALAGETSQVDITDEQFAQVNDAAAMLAAARGE